MAMAVMTKFDAKKIKNRLKHAIAQRVYWYSETQYKITYYNADIVTENHLHLVISCHVACKRLVNVYKFCVHVY